MDVRALSPEEFMLLNCGAGEDSQESLGLQWCQTSQSSRESTLNIHWKDWCWTWNSNTLATWWEELTHLKRPCCCCWERLKAGGEGDDRGWDGWMASLTQWTWVWASSGRRWTRGKPGMLLPIELQRVGHVQFKATELDWMKLIGINLERIMKHQVQGLIRRFLPQFNVDYIKTHGWRNNKVGLNTKANAVQKKLCFVLLWFG